jgi:TonB family protein
MTDPVSEELERRARLDLPWKPALLAAVAIHLAVLALLVVAPSRAAHRIVLPKVQVRLATLPVAGVRTAAASTRPSAATRPPAVPPTRHPAKQAAPPPPRHPLVKKEAERASPLAPKHPETGVEGAATEAGTPATHLTGPQSAGGGIAVGSGDTSEDGQFPYAYYLNRLLVLIESNWFRPPDAPPSRCRVLCRLDRSGRLVEAGIEQPSQTPTFDRAALRAVYASNPFPPLPQGYGGATLTLHLEFGP